ncbi:MAG: MFS transporter [Oscillospiraceae bacterium]|nr:MFS transporter [Oscillospiraceae bacterium]
MAQKLWTKNFTIITLGSVVSMLGHMISNFAIGLLVLEKTDSTFMYSFFMIMHNLPKMVTPILAGPLVDRFERKKIVYGLDFCSAAIYVFLFVVLATDVFNFGILIVVSLIIGCIDGVYVVAYESLYPNLVTKGNFRKAYSVSSMLTPIASFMQPVASAVYTTLGTVAPLFAFNAVAFFIAACCETRIDHKEEHSEFKHQKKNYIGDFKEGIAYIRGEKGLWTITKYFFISGVSMGTMMTLMLPYFKHHPHLYANIPVDVVTLYTFTTTVGLLGRMAGGMVQYKFKFPAEKKFAIAITVYISFAIMNATKLFLPVPLMLTVFFVGGMFSVTSYNIRVSATQSYIPDTLRGRFNGVFSMLSSVGSILGQFIAGVCGEFAPERAIIIGAMIVDISCVLLIMYRGREHVKPIYNQEI